MVRMTVVVTIALTALVLFRGCGKETKIVEQTHVIFVETIYDTVKPAAYATGSVSLYPRLYSYAYIYGTERALPTIDSVILCDSVMDVDTVIAGFNWGRTYLDARYDNPGDSLRYLPGDSAHMRFYSGDSVSVAVVKLLNYRDTVVIIDSLIPDSIDCGASFEATWNSVPGIDYYVVELDFGYDSLGETIWEYILSVTPDTTAIVPVEASPRDGKLVIYVWPINGPAGFDMPNNITGGPVAGKIFSKGMLTWKVVVVGSGLPESVFSGGTAERGRDADRRVLRYLTGGHIFD